MKLRMGLAEVRKDEAPKKKEYAYVPPAFYSSMVEPDDYAQTLAYQVQKMPLKKRPESEKPQIQRTRIVPVIDFDHRSP